jgi:FdhD protein
MDQRAVVEAPITRVHGASAAPAEDTLAVEEPLEIRIGRGDHWASISITMRTPGSDDELAAGFLLTEGILRRREDIVAMDSWGPFSGPAHVRNIIRVQLGPHLTPDLDRLRRNFYTTSSCGVCGKASLDALRAIAMQPVSAAGPHVPAAIIHALPQTLRKAQPVFDTTGGLHAAGLFDAQGRLIALREDVGRHNAVDKLIGHAFLNGIDVAGAILLVSGRASFELVQKAVMAGIPILAAVGAPSSLAVQLAREFQMTLAGFVRDQRFNVYSGEWRIALDEAAHQRELDPSAADTI